MLSTRLCRLPDLGVTLLFMKDDTGDAYSSLAGPAAGCVLLARGVVAVGCAILGCPVGVAILGVNGVLRPIMPLAREGVCRALALGPLSGAMVAVKVFVGRVMPPPRALLSRVTRGARRAEERLEIGGFAEAREDGVVVLVLSAVAGV